MFTTRCPHCGVKLDDFLYAGACPHCKEVLTYNLADQRPIREKVAKVMPWPVRAFFSAVRFVES